MLIDTHAHLHVKNFDADRSTVIERAKSANISKIINVGFDVEGNFQALALAKKYDFIYASFGIHPFGVSEWNDEVAADFLKTIKREPKIVAIGETGLDFYKNFQPAGLQRKVFIEQLRIARELDLAVIIHCRNAYPDVLEILKQEKIERAAMHCFSGDEAEAEEILNRGYYIGFTGVVTYKSANNLRAILKKCPMDKILLETDCPYLAPQKYRGKRNEPAYVKDCYEFCADVRHTPYDEFVSKVMANAKILFGLSS